MDFLSGITASLSTAQLNEMIFIRHTPTPDACERSDVRIKPLAGSKPSLFDAAIPTAFLLQQDASLPHVGLSDGCNNPQDQTVLRSEDRLILL